MATPGAAARLRFGRFELQPGEQRLLVDGELAALGGRAFHRLPAEGATLRDAERGALAFAPPGAT